MFITVVIATWNRGEKLARTLRSLAAQTLPVGGRGAAAGREVAAGKDVAVGLETAVGEEAVAGRDVAAGKETATGRETAAGWEAIVVNNNSTDDTAEVFARFAASPEAARLDIRMENELRQGLSWARNRGLAEARGEIIVMIDDDEEINPGFLAAYLDFFATHPAAVAAGGPMVACYEEERPRWMSHYAEALAASTIDIGPRVRRFPRGRYPIGGNMAFRREVFERIGVFDTSLGRTGQALLGGEEKDIFGRIAAAEWQIATADRRIATSDRQTAVAEWQTVASAGSGSGPGSDHDRDRAARNENQTAAHARNENQTAAHARNSTDGTQSRTTDGTQRKTTDGTQSRTTDGTQRKTTGGEIWWVPGAVVNHLIPASRLTDAHFRRLSRMVGVTARALSPGRAAYARALIAEAVKWGATLILAAWFTLTLRPVKGRYLIIMRCGITRGLLSGK